MPHNGTDANNSSFLDTSKRALTLLTDHHQTVVLVVIRLNSKVAWHEVGN